MNEAGAGAVNFDTGPQLGIVINSRVDADFRASIFDAYSDAWYPIE